MANLSYNCSLRQAFNFEKDAQYLVGHVVSITIGTTALKADTTLTLPTTYKTAAVVGVIRDWNWRGGYADPIEIAFNVSNENQKTIAVMTHTNLSNTVVVIEFNIYAFDQDAKVYYLCANVTKALNGLILKSGGELSLQVDSHNDPTVASPLNFPVYIGIMPHETAQTINFAVSNSDKFVKTWGVAVTGS